MKYALVGQMVGTAVGRLVKMAGQDTTLKNAIRDRAYFAWIPEGDTCVYCLMIAAEGWQRASASALSGGHAEHIHGNCNCSYAIRHDKDTEYGGYNPSDYAKQIDRDRIRKLLKLTQLLKTSRLRRLSNSFVKRLLLPKLKQPKLLLKLPPLPQSSRLAPSTSTARTTPLVTPSLTITALPPL